MKDRLFIAINFSAAVRSELAELQDGMRKNARRGSFAHPDNIHLTVVFIGDCDKLQTEAVIAVMDGIRFRPFDITVDRTGNFPRHGGSTWWAGVSDNSVLSAVRDEIAERLTDRGFDIDRRRYRPHITLGREVVTDDLPKNAGPFIQPVRSIELMRSRRADGKTVYDTIHSKKAEG